MPAHDESLAGDTLYTIRFNFEWRKIIAAALEGYFSHGYEGMALDNDDLFNNLLNDLYSAERINVKTTLLAYTLPANATTTSSTPALASGTEFNHTFSHKKAKIAFSNVRCGTLAPSEFVHIRVNTAAGTMVQNTVSGANSNTNRNVRLVALVEDLPIGTPVQISLYFWRTPSGTGTIFTNANMVIEIEEWD